MFTSVTCVCTALTGSRNSDEQVQTTEEELQDLKQVWSAVTGIWDEIEQMRDTPWNSLQPRKIRQQLEGVLTAH